MQTPVEVISLWSDDIEVTSVKAGENVKAKLKGVEEEDVSPGFVLCDAPSPCRTGRIFDAQVVIIEHKSIICAGYSAICHIHTVAEEVSVVVRMQLIFFPNSVQFFSFVIRITFGRPSSVLLTRNLEKKVK